MAANFEVVYEDNHLLAVNKASGILSQGDKTGDDSILELAKAYLVKKYDKSGEAYLGLPHRLDRPTSGLIILAKTSKALSRLNKMFQDHEVQKTYWAVVKDKPNPPNGHLRHYLVRDNQKNKSTAFDKEMPGGKLAELDYQTLYSLDNYHLLEVKPKTGRHHQIRSQLAKIGCPIKGDLKYGFPRSNHDASIHLHARSAEFIHPVKKEKMRITAPANSKDPIWKVCNKAFPAKASEFL
ncbi:MAG: RNA pseudouridine synthase [Flavobacteriales bacterium]|nr:RNA pseudouridine synthase [Flavobacteriales bacterium]